MSEPVLRGARPVEHGPNTAHISLPAIEHNTRQVAGVVGEHTALMAVVKADGYGHGMLNAARAALAGGATWLGVAHLHSALELVRAGFDVPILAWLYEPVSAATLMPQVVGAGIEVAVSSREQLDLVSASARHVGRRARVHIKMDTGMGRGGVLEPLVESMGAAIHADDHLVLSGAMTHLADAEQIACESITRQVERFDAMCAAVQAQAGPIAIRHLANSASALTRPDLHYDMVRVGIALYGYAPVDTHLEFRPAMTLRSRIAVVKDVQASQAVGYGGQWVAPNATRLGVVPIGYADGLHREFSQRMNVLVRGDDGEQLAAQVGRISMDQIVVDLGPHSRARAGDEVVVFGDPRVAPGAPSAEDWARMNGTIAYEIVTSVNERVAKVVTDLAHELADSSPARPDQRSVTVSTRGAHDTRRAARAIASIARAGDLFVLDGPLGAGKTTFAQGFAQALNVSGHVASPTFVISRVHPSLDEGPDLVHVDAYRLDEQWDIEDLDLDSEMDASVTLVEWGRERVEHLSDSYAVVELHRFDGRGADDDPGEWDDPDDTDEPRSLTVTFVGPRFSNDDVLRVGAALREAGFDGTNSE